MKKFRLGDNMKNFELMILLDGNELLIAETHTPVFIKSYVENQEDVLRCIKNYIDIYVEGKRK